MTRTTGIPATVDADLTALARKLAARPDLLLRLDAPGCRGADCPRPAVHDHSTGVWRHLDDLSRCHTDRDRLTANHPADATGRQP
jgi:hypothetical protein